MSALTDSSEFRDLEDSVLALAARIRNLREAVSALSALTAEVVSLQEALSALTPGVLPEPPRPSGEQPGATDAPETEPHLAVEPGPRSITSPSVNGAHSGSANGAGRPADSVVREAPQPQPARKAGPNLAVTVSTQGGSVDLVRLYRALQRLPQVMELNLTSYNGGRAVVGLTTAAQPRELAIEAALQEAFPEGVVGDWTGDAEFVAVIAAAG